MACFPRCLSKPLSGTKMSDVALRPERNELIALHGESLVPYQLCDCAWEVLQGTKRKKQFQSLRDCAIGRNVHGLWTS